MKTKYPAEVSFVIFVKSLTKVFKRYQKTCVWTWTMDTVHLKRLKLPKLQERNRQKKKTRNVLKPYEIIHHSHTRKRSGQVYIDKAASKRDIYE